ncbi:MAG: 3-phosphoshikimate 1-carboxyvinyltransferase, partial [Alphaproteobacteria bacterium]|nr:3-phosphoshikimate 1-carboxyvinyltransferase [Alphaproteobacteria bacterium]
MTRLIASPTKSLSGTLRVPGDKSISHRALMFASLAIGESRIKGLLESEDVHATAGALRAMGSVITRDGADWLVRGVGVGGYLEPETVLDMGNSGTSTRLLLGLLASQNITAFFSGDASLSRRPMQRVITPLSRCGAVFTSRMGGRLPLGIRGAEQPIPIDYTLPVASAQVKSAILLAGLNINGTTRVVEKYLSRDHTERMLAAIGADISILSDSHGTRVIEINGGRELSPLSLTVPADPSSAAFPMVAAIITKDSELVLPDVCLNPTRTGLITTLREMGADIKISDESTLGGEPVGTLTVRSSSGCDGRRRRRFFSFRGQPTAGCKLLRTFQYILVLQKQRRAAAHHDISFADQLEECKRRPQPVACGSDQNVRV